MIHAELFVQTEMRDVLTKEKHNHEILFDIMRNL